MMMDQQKYTISSEREEAHSSPLYIQDEQDNSRNNKLSQLKSKDISLQIVQESPPGKIWSNQQEIPSQTNDMSKSPNKEDSFTGNYTSEECNIESQQVVINPTAGECTDEDIVADHAAKLGEFTQNFAICPPEVELKPSPIPLQN